MSNYTELTTRLRRQSLDLAETGRAKDFSIGNEAAAAIEALQRENAELRKDAERYRRIRESDDADVLIKSDCRGLYLPQREALDTAVDTTLFTTPAQRGEIAGDGKPCNNNHDPDCRWPDCNCRIREAQLDALKGASNGLT